MQLQLVHFRRVPITYPAKRCVVCGDKIKDSPGQEQMMELIDYLPQGELAYLERCCEEYFTHGHPDRDEQVNRQLIAV